MGLMKNTHYREGSQVPTVGIQGLWKTLDKVPVHCRVHTHSMGTVDTILLNQKSLDCSSNIGSTCSLYTCSRIGNHLL